MKKDVHGTQKKNSNPMGIGLGIDYVTWWEILKWIPPPSKLHVGTRFNNSWARVVKTSLLRARAKQNRKISISQDSEQRNEQNMKSRIERSILQSDP